MMTYDILERSLPPKDKVLHAFEERLRFLGLGLEFFRLVECSDVFLERLSLIKSHPGTGIQLR